MENVLSRVRTQKSKGLYQRIVVGLLSNFKVGKMHLVLPSGEGIVFGDKDSEFAVDLTIESQEFFRDVVIYGDIGFGEAYYKGLFTTSDLTSLIRWVIKNIEYTGIMSGSKKKSKLINLMGTLNRVGHLVKRNSHEGSKKNISFHYDLSNRFYELMLDKSMSYSCGVFNYLDSTLEEAQEEKLRLICEDLDLKEGDHVLEIGCGWGSFAIYAAKNYGVKVKGITLSKEQEKYALARVEEEGLVDQVDIRLIDYRDISGKFDKIVSIEMIEAVGDEYLGDYFKKISSLLKKNGALVIQAITCPDSRYEEFKKGVDFIQKHIFPGSLLPSVEAIVSANKKEHTDFSLYHMRDIGTHYARTLEIWRNKVFANRSMIESLGMDDEFFLKWEYYLCYCEAAFIERNISTAQMCFIKPNNTEFKHHQA